MAVDRQQNKYTRQVLLKLTGDGSRVQDRGVPRAQFSQNWAMDYTPIPTDAEEVQQEQSQRALEADSWRTSWSFCIAIVGIIITTANLAFLSVETRQYHSPPPPVTRRGSTYIGLDQLIRNESSAGWPLSRHSFPDYLGVINARMPEKIQPGSRRVLVDSTHRAFAHFTVHDFGLESCALSLFSPGPNHSDGQNSTSNRSAEIDIWLLDNREWMKNPSWPIRWSRTPQRNDFLGTLNVSRTRDETPFFRCPSGSAQLFAIECRTEGCSLDFQQVRSGPKLGFWMLQSEAKMALD